MAPKVKEGNFYVGTSNVVIPGNRQSFPEKYRHQSRLHYYSTIFNSVEINSTFYKLPRAATFEKWSVEVPNHFKFSIKLLKEITHVKDLHFDEEVISRFITSSKLIGIKKGCVLVQLPGKITLDLFGRLELLLQKIKEADPENEWTIAIEFRNDSWYAGETFELLDEFNATMVLHDIKKGKNSSVHEQAPAAYIRYHGPAGDYRGSYDSKYLIAQATMIRTLLRKGKDVYAYFNNTMGNAFENATSLQQLVNNPAKKI